MEQNPSTTQTQWKLIKPGTKENTLHGSITKKIPKQEKVIYGIRSQDNYLCGEVVTGKGCHRAFQDVLFDDVVPVAWVYLHCEN